MAAIIGKALITPFKELANGVKLCAGSLCSSDTPAPLFAGMTLLLGLPAIVVCAIGGVMTIAQAASEDLPCWWVTIYLVLALLCWVANVAFSFFLFAKVRVDASRCLGEG